MRRLPFRNIMLWLTILTLLWSSQGYSYVWCMTTDGPTHLESALDSHCDREKADARTAIAGEGDADCGPCFDLDATHDTLQHRTLSGFSPDAPLLLSPDVHPRWAAPVLVRYLAKNLIPEDPPRVATTLLVHRTIVLLI